MDLETLKQIVRLMVENDLSEVDLREGEETVTIKRGGAGPVMVAHHPAPMSMAAPSAGPVPAAAQSAPAAPAENLPAIESPMVGTFYAAPDPDSPAFVAVGKQVRVGDVVCIIEAMKVFNEIKAEKAGVVERILVENGQAVEYGQRMFLLRPA